MSTTSFVPTQRTRLRRAPQRGSFDRNLAYSIIQEAMVCHVAFFVDEQPFCIPTIHARVDDHLYLHGAPASRLLKQLSKGVPICVTLTLIDGIVLARSAFHHSMNYRSLVVLGTATQASQREEKLAAFRAMTERLSPGRWENTRAPTDREIRATSVLKLPIEEASVKTRSGPPIDDEEDYQLPHWAGVIPVLTTLGTPEPDLSRSATKVS